MLLIRSLDEYFGLGGPKFDIRSFLSAEDRVDSPLGTVGGHFLSRLDDFVQPQL